MLRPSGIRCQERPRTAQDVFGSTVHFRLQQHLLPNLQDLSKEHRAS